MHVAVACFHTCVDQMTQWKEEREIERETTAPRHTTTTHILCLCLCLFSCIFCVGSRFLVHVHVHVHENVYVYVYVYVFVYVCVHSVILKVV